MLSSVKNKAIREISYTRATFQALTGTCYCVFPLTSISKDKVKYEYKYADSNSERHSVYSWKLVATDKVPEGKQGGASLRDMEKQIQKDLEDNLLIYQTRKDGTQFLFGINTSNSRKN